MWKKCKIALKFTFWLAKNSLTRFLCVCFPWRDVFVLLRQKCMRFSVTLRLLLLRWILTNDGTTFYWIQFTQDNATFNCDKTFVSNVFSLFTRRQISAYIANWNGLQSDDCIHAKVSRYLVLVWFVVVQTTLSERHVDNTWSGQSRDCMSEKKSNNWRTVYHQVGSIYILSNDISNGSVGTVAR